jgi:hypothetical protein
MGKYVVKRCINHSKDSAKRCRNHSKDSAKVLEPPGRSIQVK